MTNRLFQIAATCLTSLLLIISAAPAQLTKTNQFPSLTFSSPVGLSNAGDGTDRLFVVEQTGKIQVFPNVPSTSTKKVFLDITDSVSGTGGAGEMGLLGLAFHPQYSVNGYFYIDYTVGSAASLNIRTRISRFQVSSTNPDSAVRNSEVILIDQPQPFENHKGGQLAFGPDGYLYIAFGDGGAGGDPQGNGQNKSTLLAKILRINVDSAANGKNYAIPPTNPFVDSIGFKKEIYAYGLRNPWRFSFDGSTLWAADVGQETWEEIDTIQNGKNYGWNIMEGNHCYPPGSGCNQTGLTLPIWEYQHLSGLCSISGGFVYRGANIPQLNGKYIYGDYCTGDIWSLDARSPGPATNTFLFNASSNIFSFGVDKFNELYFCGSSGKIYKIAVTAPITPTLVSPANAQINVSRTPVLVWRTSPWASSYRLQVSTDSTFASTFLDDSTITDTSKQVGPLGTLTKYFWRVRAKNSGGTSAFAVKRNFTTLNDATPPTTPVLLSPSNGAIDVPLTVTLRWATSSGAVTYHLQVATDSLFSAMVTEDSTLIDTSKQVGPLNYSTTYFWRVQAKNASGVSSYSSKSNFLTVTPPPPPPAPTLIFPAQGAIDQPSNLTFRWSKAAGATTYHIQIASDSAFSAMVSQDSAIVDTFTQAGTFSFGATYYWRVRAGNIYGHSAFTPIRNFTAALYSASYHLQKGWNIVSLPVKVLDGKKGTLFPTSVSHAYSYVPGGSYVISDSMIPGLGYWLKFADSQHVVISGTPIAYDTIDIAIGWNMIGTVTNVVPMDSIALEPPGISNGIFFGYSASYYQAASLQPSMGYWIKATAPGKVVIQSGGTLEMISGEMPILKKPGFQK